MKTLTFLFLLITTSISFYSCTKTNPNPVSSAYSHWIYNGVTYALAAGDSTFGDITSVEGSLVTAAPDGLLSDFITFTFYPIPTKDGSYTYAVINSHVSTLAPSQAALGFGSNTVDTQYGSTGGGTINVTMLKGRITATFSNILASSVLNSSVTTTISGTLVQNAGVVF